MKRKSGIIIDPVQQKKSVKFSYNAGQTSRKKIKTKEAIAYPAPPKDLGEASKNTQEDADDRQRVGTSTEEVDVSNPSDTFHIQIDPLDTQKQRSGTSATSSQNSFLRQWVEKRSEYLEHLLEREGLASCATCVGCGSTNPTWRCKDCVSQQIFCQRCLLTRHSTAPFHRIEKWNDGFFSGGTFGKLGLVINFGHNGRPCPTSVHRNQRQHSGVTSTIPDCDVDGSGDEDINDDAQDEEVYSAESVGLGFADLKPPKGADSFGNPWMTVIHTTGVHYIPIRFCACPNALSRDLQLLDHGLYPATQRRPRTAFTFQVLDDFQLENLECKTAARNYFEKLKRLSSNTFPHLIQDRYRDLLRISRQWNNLMLRKRAGIGYTGTSIISPGGLVDFCPACPRPGVNLPDGWKDDPDKFKYMQTIVMDGNFRSEHLRMQNPNDDVFLADGHGYMVESGPYEAHLRTAKDYKEACPSKCNDHRAVNKVNREYGKVLDVTGIGACACGRHGCFFPHSVVDFQKGERQMNMDYSFCQALKICKLCQQVLHLYDVNCSYWEHLLRRISESSFLDIPKDMELFRAIGLFHVHGHRDECFPQFAPSFITGAGQIDGEIIETLWVPLNDIASSTRNMSKAYRQELLDFHINDSNWKKLTKMVPALLKKWNGIHGWVDTTRNAYDNLCRMTPKRYQTKWLQEEATAQKERWEDRTVMNVYDVIAEKQPSRAQIELDLATNETQRGNRAGSTHWLSQGLQIRNAQLSLQAEVRRLGRNVSVDDQVKIHAKRQKLQASIDNFRSDAARYLEGVEIDSSVNNDNVPAAQIWGVDDEDEDLGIDSDSNPETAQQHPRVESESTAVHPEHQPLPLPSSLKIGNDAPLAPELQRLAKQQLQLEIGQANDALHKLRIAIGHKSMVFRTEVRQATNYAKRNRSYDETRKLQVSISFNADAYRNCRRAMVALDAKKETLEMYQVLDKDHLKAVTSVWNDRGSRNEVLSWIWNVKTARKKESPPWLDEFYRVSFLRAYARMHRFKEEKATLEREISSTKLYFEFKESLWRSRSTGSGCGKDSYALKQANQWTTLSQYARVAEKEVAKVLANLEAAE